MLLPGIAEGGSTHYPYLYTLLPRSLCTLLQAPHQLETHLDFLVNGAMQIAQLADLSLQSHNSSLQEEEKTKG